MPCRPYRLHILRTIGDPHPDCKVLNTPLTCIDHLLANNMLNIMPLNLLHIFICLLCVSGT